jgi:hypothetical protein
VNASDRVAGGFALYLRVLTCPLDPTALDTMTTLWAPDSLTCGGSLPSLRIGPRTTLERRQLAMSDWCGALGRAQHLERDRR